MEALKLTCDLHNSAVIEAKPPYRKGLKSGIVYRKDLEHKVIQLSATFLYICICGYHKQI